MPRVFGGTVTVDLWVDVMRKAETVFGKGGDFQEGEPYREVRNDRREERVEPAPVDDVNPSGDPIPGTPSDSEPLDPNIPLADPPVSPEPDGQPRNEEEYEIVDVCADSGKRSTMYCSETVRRSFEKGKAPRGSCRLHGG